MARLRVPLALCALLLVTELMLRLASLGGAPLVFDVGPSTGSYGGGFTYSLEYRPVTARFCGRGCGIDLPLEADAAEARLVLHVARLEAKPATVRVTASGDPLAELTIEPSRPTLRDWQRSGARGTPFDEMRRVEVPIRWPGGPAQLRLDVTESDVAGFALAVDWIRIEGPRWRLRPAAWPLRALAAGVFVVFLVAGFGWRGAFAAGLTTAAGSAAYFAASPFAAAYAAAHLVAVVIGLGLLAAARLQRHAGGRWVAAAFVAGYLLKGAGLFHPSAYYPDTLTHARYVIAFARAEGTIAERGRTAQRSAGVGLSRPVAGRQHVMPYSPIFYLPFTALPPEPEALGLAMKHVALAAAALEVIAVFALARLLFGAASGVAAAALAALLPPLYSRLLLSLWPTIVGHLADVIAILAAAALLADPRSRRRLAPFAGATTAALFTYIASLFNLSTFAAALAVLHRRAAPRLIAVTAASAGLTVLLLYRGFVGPFVHEIVPTWMNREALPTVSASAPAEAGLLAAFARVPLFYGYGYPALAVAALVLARRRLPPERFAVLAAYGAAFVVLLLVRGVSSTFRDLKETTFVAPFMAVTAGYVLETLAARGPRERVAAWMIAIGLAGFGLMKYASYLEAALLPTS